MTIRDVIPVVNNGTNIGDLELNPGLRAYLLDYGWVTIRYIQYIYGEPETFTWKDDNGRLGQTRGLDNLYLNEEEAKLVQATRGISDG